MIRIVTGIILFIIGLWLTVGMIGSDILAKNQYNNEIYNYWSLADKSSTIETKSEYIDKFVYVLDNAGLHGKYNAIWLQNPDNSFDKNLEMLKTLQTRLHEIKQMNVSSFEYQQAISQITSQEQGEAHEMLSVFSGVWYLKNHTWLWDWISIFLLISGVNLLWIGGALIHDDLCCDW
uniref:Uncharacterized protein n=1 Tax=viral metagenome TaxID=1070528 RepID=A0A6H1ZTP1_9ZZZZ